MSLAEKINSRATNLYACVIVGLMLAFSYYLQVYQGVNPCPLCIMQRFALGAMGIIFFVGMLFCASKKSRLTSSALAYLVALAGALLAARQVWIQHLPANATADCGASLSYMLQVLPFAQVMQKVLTGSAECSLVDWRFLQLSLAEWSLISFCGFLFFTGYQFFAAWRTPR